MLNKISLLSLIAGLGFSMIGCDDDNCVHPVPESYTFEATTARGCSDFVTYFDADNQENTVFLKVSITEARTQFSAEESDVITLDLPAESLTVELVRWDRNARGQYCNDLIDPSNTPIALQTFTAISGRAILTADIPADIDFQPVYNQFYKVNVQLEDVILEDTLGVQIKVSKLSFEQISVGSLAG